MRLYLLILAFTAALLVMANPAASPPKPRQALHQVTRGELNARAKYPDLFNKRDSTPSGGTTPCRRRRAFHDQVDYILDAKETAAFLLGRGSFTWKNGTTFTDHDFVNDLAVSTHKSYYHQVYNVVKDRIGNKLLEISIPHYKKWKQSLTDGELVYLSPSTEFRAKDVDELERVLLEDPEFVDVQWQGFRINRRFFEVANSY